MTVSKIASFAAVRVLLFVSTIPAVASPLHPTRLFHRTPSVAQKQSVVVEFRSTTMEHRALQVGNDRFTIAPHGTLRLSVLVGSPVLVRSEQNSRIDGATLMTVSPESRGQQIVVN